MNASSAHALSQMRANRAKGRRRFVTPEGVDLNLEIASAGARFSALLVDLLIMLLALIFMSWVLGSVMRASAQDGLAASIWLVGFFVLRNGWFLGFELGARAATPGKRLLGIRVVARDGGRLEVSSVVARNLVRELEMFLPITFLFSGGSDGFSWALFAAAMSWTLVFSFFLLFNKDRMRFGDIIGGTWVVNAPRKALRVDLSTVGEQAHSALRFTDAELAVYGIYELQELERVLRDRDAKTMRIVADTIRQKINRPFTDEDADFLIAYYRQLRERLEKDLLMGRRRENKFEAAR